MPTMTWRLRPVIAAAVLAMGLGGCTVTSSHPHGSAAPVTQNTSRADTPPPLTKEQATAQVVDAAKQIVAVAGLQNPDGNSRFQSCNDQGDPPYMATVFMNFERRSTDVDEASFYQQVADAMQANGWTSGSQPGERHHGTVLHKNGVTAVIARNPARDNMGVIDLHGECRVTGPKRLGGGARSIDFGS